MYENSPIAFCVTSTSHGMMIVNRNDYHEPVAGHGYGVGYQILNNSCYDPQEVQIAKFLLAKRLQYFGEGVHAVDCGANIGVHTIEWAKQLGTHGKVTSIEAQKKVYYALCGNVVMNNCLNVECLNVAISDKKGQLKIPLLDYLRPASFGSLELKQHDRSEFIGQNIDKFDELPAMPIDQLNLGRVDFLKIDVEGMEFEALSGAKKTISKNKPIILIEKIKVDSDRLHENLKDFGYTVLPIGLNFLAVDKDDPTLNHINSTGSQVTLS